MLENAINLLFKNCYKKRWKYKNFIYKRVYTAI